MAFMQLYPFSFIFFCPVLRFSLYSIHNATKKAILNEIAKCDAVCANCHRERTHQRRTKKLQEEKKDIGNFI
jgi:hypothetical protein